MVPLLFLYTQPVIEEVLHYIKELYKFSHKWIKNTLHSFSRSLIIFCKCPTRGHWTTWKMNRITLTHLIYHMKGKLRGECNITSPRWQSIYQELLPTFPKKNHDTFYTRGRDWTMAFSIVLCIERRGRKSIRYAGLTPLLLSKIKRLCVSGVWLGVGMSMDTKKTCV